MNAIAMPTLAGAPAPQRDTLPTDPAARATAVAGQFEAIFVQQMVEGLRRTVDPTGESGGLFGDGPGSDTYAAWYDRLLGEHVTAAGRVGVADAILAQLRRHGQLAAPAPTPNAGGADVVA